MRDHVADETRDARSPRRDNSKAEVALQHSLPDPRLAGEETVLGFARGEVPCIEAATQPGPGRSSSRGNATVANRSKGCGVSSFREDAGNVLTFR